MEEPKKSQHFHGTERTEVGLGRGRGRRPGGRRREGLVGGGGDVLRVRPGKPHHRRPGLAPQRPGGPGAPRCVTFRAAPGFHSDRGAGRRGGCGRTRPPPRAARVALLRPPEPGVDRAWGRRGALSRGAAGAPARSEDRPPEGPRVSAALSSPGRVSTPHGQALSGLLLSLKVTPLNRLWPGRLFVSDILVLLFRLLNAPLAQLRRLGASITDSPQPRGSPQTPPHRNLHEGPPGSGSQPLPRKQRLPDALAGAEGSASITSAARPCPLPRPRSLLPASGGHALKPGARAWTRRA